MRDRKEYFKQYNQTRPHRERDWKAIYQKEKQRIAYNLLRKSKNHLYKRPMDHTITEQDIIVPDLCPVFNIPFDDQRLKPSLDRIDNNKGYVPGNVQVISLRANIMKHDASAEELVKFALWILKSYNPQLLSCSSCECEHDCCHCRKESTNPSDYDQQLFRHDASKQQPLQFEGESYVHSLTSEWLDCTQKIRHVSGSVKTNHTIGQDELQRLMKPGITPTMYL